MSLINIQRHNSVSLVVVSVLASVTVGVIVSKLVVFARKNNAKEKNLPLAPSGILANIQCMSGSQAPFFLLGLARQMKRYSFRIRLPIPGGGAYIIADYDLTSAILKEAKSDKPRMTYGTFDVIGGASSMFTSPNNAYWRFARKATAPAFSKTEISRMVQIATSNVQTWMEKLDDMIAKNDSFDPSFEMVKLTFAVICSAGFEFTPTDDDYHNFAESLEISLREFSFKQGLNPLRQIFGFVLPEVREAKRHCQNLQTFAAHVLQTYRANPNKSSNNTIIRLIAENPNFPSDKERIAEIIAFLTGGHDTTGFTVASTLILLAKHKTVMEKLRAELNQCTATEEWPNVEYFKCVVKESMRLLPVAAMGSVRHTGSAHVYNGEIVPKGAFCIFPFYVVFRNEAVFEKPDEFIPERWLNPTDAMKDSFIPFAIGNRNCAGQALAKAEIDSVLPLLVTCFDFELEYEGELDYFLTLKYAGAKLRAKRV